LRLRRAGPRTGTATGGRILSPALIIFDVDGTLIDSQDLLYRTHIAAFGEHGLEPPARQAILRLVGLSLPVMMEELAGPDAPVAALVASYKAHFSDIIAREGVADPLFPGAAEALARLSARPGLQLGIATGKSRRGVARLVGHFGWDGLFSTVQTADDAPSKPHPGMVLQALAETGVEPGAAMLVGDTTFDIEMARAAGVRAVGVAWGYHPPASLIEAGAERILGHFDELEP
jgi:phosphoglycolate phosphatase